MIVVSIDGGESKEFSAGVRISDALKELLSGKKRKATLAVQNESGILDLSEMLLESTTLIPITVDSEAGLEILRHSTAHIMAYAVKEIYGEEVKVAIGPSIEDGFYYDFDRSIAVASSV